MIPELDNVSAGAVEASARLDMFVDDVVAANAERTPRAVAIVTADNTVSYRELVSRIRRIGAALVAKGIGRGCVVGVLTDRTVDMVATVLAIWKAGATLLPLDPMFPKARLAFMVEDSQAKLIVTDHVWRDHVLLRDADTLRDGVEKISVSSLLEAKPVEADMSRNMVEGRPSPAYLPAYILYTSGSTGQPKGVLNHHRALLNHLWSMADRPGISQDDRLLSVTTLSFDIALLELFLPLIAGATLVLPSGTMARDGHQLVKMIDEHGITVMQGTPATWRLLLRAGWKGTASMKVLCGGEVLPNSLVKELLPKVGSLWNL
ncbi:MAG: AMP-binding protein, partial [Pseudomonadota bacterium]